MNALAFVMALLLMIGHSQYLLFRKKEYASKLHSYFCSYMQANRDGQDKAETELYLQRVKEEAPPSTPKQRTHNTKRIRQLGLDWTWDREQKPCAQLNLYPLLEPTAEESVVKLLTELLNLFYEGQSFYQHNVHKDLSKVFTQEILRSLRGQKERTPNERLYLEQIVFQDPLLQSIFYKMLQGSISYDFMAGTGYPSLLTFVKVMPVNPRLKMVCINHASIEMLYLLLGPLTPIILEEMKKQDQPRLTQTLFKECLDKSPEIEISESRQRLIAFSHPQHTTQSIKVEGTDKNNKVSVTRTVCY